MSQRYQQLDEEATVAHTSYHTTTQQLRISHEHEYVVLILPTLITNNQEWLRYSSYTFQVA